MMKRIVKEMREILYRGRSEVTGDWVFGSLRRKKVIGGVYVYIIYKDLPSTVYVNGVVVDSQTVGQYTGLDDKNGVKIFEGDDVKGYTSSDLPVWGTLEYNRGQFEVAGVCIGQLVDLEVLE